MAQPTLIIPEQFVDATEAQPTNPLPPPVTTRTRQAHPTPNRRGLANSQPVLLPTRAKAPPADPQPPRESIREQVNQMLRMRSLRPRMRAEKPFWLQLLEARQTSPELQRLIPTLHPRLREVRNQPTTLPSSRLGTPAQPLPGAQGVLQRNSRAQLI